MVQGTSSDAGKTTVVAGLCRILARAKIRVAPFKPQNMALNSAVTQNGGEIGRAQALQAQACGIEAHTDMNPVLIKPSSDLAAQIIIQGQPLKDMDAQGFHDYKPLAQRSVLDSFSRLSEQYQCVIVEGAGSPAEVNLREGDIANMGFAEAVDCPVILVADIDRGGVFAQLVGTLALLSTTEQARVLGFVINKFRGDIALLEPGLKWLEARTGKPVFGVLPYLRDFYIDSEDAIDLRQQTKNDQNRLRVVVPVLPRISNHTDFDSLRLHPQVELIFVSCFDAPPPADLIILPGSKNVRADLATLFEQAWFAAIQKHLRYGGKLIGICGGFQMLGEDVVDEQGVEGISGRAKGFGFIPMTTTFLQDKTLCNKHGKFTLMNQTVEVSGYEIHHGVSDFQSPAAAILQFDDGSSDGYLDRDEQILGCYLHGIFDTPAALSLILRWAGLGAVQHQDVNAIRERELDRLADALEEHCDIEALFCAAFGAQFLDDFKSTAPKAQSKNTGVSS